MDTPTTVEDTTSIGASDEGASTPSSQESNVESELETTTRPGAYVVSRAPGGPANIFKVTVPSGVEPGSEFSVHAGSCRVRVRCPANVHSGESLQITLPRDPVTFQTTLMSMAPLTDPKGDGEGGAVKMTEEVANLNTAAAEKGETPRTFLVTIPADTYPGMQFTVMLEGKRFTVTCPDNAGPNMKVRIVPPTRQDSASAAPNTQVFEVSIPPEVRPNQHFSLSANGQRVLLKCPAYAVPGQKIRFQLPINQEAAAGVRLSYGGDRGGWCRMLRVDNLKFQWVWVGHGSDESNPVAFDENFSFKKAGYVRKLNLLEGNDARMRTGTIEFCPASEAVAESKLVANNRVAVSYSDIASVQGKTLDAKASWFRGICSRLTVDWEVGLVKICVRRRNLLQDSVEAVMALGREDMRKVWRIDFLDEPSVETTGLAQEWFQLVSEQIFDPEIGLWLPQNQVSMAINPESNVACGKDHLVYFRFLGRMMGRALFDQRLLSGHLSRHIYKHILEFPVTFEDLEHEDNDLYRSLEKLTEMDDIPHIPENMLGKCSTKIDLVEGGAQRKVTKDNLVQYLEANLKYRMLGCVERQLTEVLLGFFDVIPEAPLAVFDFREMELLICGLPAIDLDDWEVNTEYSGLFEGEEKTCETVTWFWEIVRENFDEEMKARLLQFVTGTAAVPVGGFAMLRGTDGNTKRFSIHGVDADIIRYPRAQSWCNRLDLPSYDAKEELEEKLKAVTLCSGVYGCVE